jgi:bleomycin hydrolase
MGFLAVGLPARGSFANAVHFAEGFLPDDYAASHTGEMVALMSARLRKAVTEVRQPNFDDAKESDLREWKLGTLKDIYKILVLCLGQPPESFQWRYENKDGKVTPLKKHTPQSFRRKFLEADLNRYVSFVNYPGQPMHAHLEWAWERNMAAPTNLDAVNISMPEMVDMTVKSILADQPVWFAANSGE